METVKIKETSKSGVIANIGGVFGQINGSQFTPYTPDQLEKKTAYRDQYGWSDYSSIEDWAEERARSKEERRAEREAEEAKMNAVIASPNDYTPMEIWKAAIWLHQQPMSGWRGADIVLGDNPLSNALIANIGSYTVSPFDDGTLMIKAGGKRYGNKRGWGDVSDLL